MISENYKAQLAWMHDRKMFAGRLNEYDDAFSIVTKHQPSSILDYGCAHGNLVNKLKEDFPDILVDGYDPAVEKYHQHPSHSYDLIFCLDVMEHLELEYLDQIIEGIDKLTNQYCYMVIACYPAVKKLPDGRNTHIIIENPDWWINKLNKHLNECIIDDYVVHKLKNGHDELRVMLKNG